MQERQKGVLNNREVYDMSKLHEEGRKHRMKVFSRMDRKEESVSST